MNSDQLFETTLDLSSNNVSMIKIMLEDLQGSSDEMEIQLGKDADKRKESMAKFEVDVDDLEK